MPHSLWAKPSSNGEKPDNDGEAKVLKAWVAKLLIKATFPLFPLGVLLSFYKQSVEDILF